MLLQSREIILQNQLIFFIIQIKCLNILLLLKIPQLDSFPEGIKLFSNIDTRLIILLDYQNNYAGLKLVARMSKQN